MFRKQCFKTIQHHGEKKRTKQPKFGKKIKQMTKQEMEKKKKKKGSQLQITPLKLTVQLFRSEILC